MAYGTLQVADLLATTQPTIIAFGEDKVYQAIDDALTMHNALMRDKMQTLVGEVTIDRLRRYGGVSSMQMEETDEFNRVDVQKVTTGQNIGFPLRRGSIALQWTRDFMENHTPAELAEQFVAAQDADVMRVDRMISRAFFLPTNYTFVDRLVDELQLPVKALLNADGVQIPYGPNAASFNGATHTHYVGATTLTQAALSALIVNVTEHFTTGKPKVYISRSEEATVRSFTNAAGGADVFVPYVDARILVADNTTRANGNLDMSNLMDRAIGVYGQAEIWVKPWIPSGYLLCWMDGGPKPLVAREKYKGGGDFRLDYDNDSHPLRARQLSRTLGMSVFNRHCAAVLFVGNATYTAPVGL